MKLSHRARIVSLVLGFVLFNLLLLHLNAPALYFSVSGLVYLGFSVWALGLVDSSNDGLSMSHIGSMPLTLTDAVPRQRLMNELDMAKRVQEGLLKIESPDISGIQIAKRCIPAASVGGDFYTFVSRDFTALLPKEKSPGIVEYFDQHDTHLGLVIGDVAGHGVSSALVMALSSGLLTEVGQQFRSPSKILTLTNSKLLRFIENSQITHVTAFYGTLNTSTMEFTYSKAGHPAALLQRADGRIESLDSEGVFLGMFSNAQYEECSVILEAGDRLFLYTDGLTETKGEDGELFGIDRFKSLLSSLQDQPIQVVLSRCFQAVDDYSNHQPAKDDRSLVILEVG